MESVKFTITAGRREAIDNLIRAEVKKKFGHPVAIEAALDHRYSNREGNAEKKIAGWSGYERFMLAGGFTVYVGLTNPSEPSVSVSEKPDKYAMAKVEKRNKREADRAARKAAKAVKVVKHDSKLPEIKATGRQVKGVPTPAPSKVFDDLAATVAKIQRTEKISHTKAVAKAKELVKA